MKGNGGKSNFQFISISNVPVPQDPSTRKIIRRHAMSKAAAARRQRGNYGRNNRRQQPVFVEEQSVSSDPSRPSESIGPESSALKSAEAVIPTHDIGQRPESDVRDDRFSSSLLLGRVIPARLSSKGYEFMRIQYDFDILDLSALTGFHSGRATVHALSHQPSLLVEIMCCRQWSYISYLPSRYGHTVCLDDAIRCVAAKVRFRLSSPTAPLSATVLALYSKALASLQAALSDPQHCLQAEVLCATEILALYELLNGKEDAAWVRHVAGAISLVKLRGPGKYNTDFEKALFFAQAGPTFTEALLKGSSCFLEEEPWQAVLLSVIDDSSAFAHRIRISVSLWMTMCQIPRLFNETEDSVRRLEAVGSHGPEELTFRLCHMRDSLVDWRNRYEELLLKHSNDSLLQARMDRRYETLGSVLGMLTLMNRLILALNLDRVEQLEGESQSLAHQIIKLERTAYLVNPRAGVFMALKTILARATIATKDEWQEYANPGDEKPERRPRIISEEVFRHWCSLIGRKATLCA